jgi:hypothetical protein
LFAAPHGLSQRTTSFIACACQGIHRTPFRHLIALIVDARHGPETIRQRSASSMPCRRADDMARPFRRSTEQVLKDQCHTRTARRRRGHAPPAFAGPLRDFRTTLLFTMSIAGPRPAKIRKRKPAAGRPAGFCFLIPMSLVFAGAGAWWSQTGSNRRPPACKAGALPTELWPR